MLRICCDGLDPTRASWISVSGGVAKPRLGRTLKRLNRRARCFWELGRAQLLSPGWIESPQPAHALAHRRVRDEQRREPFFGERVDRKSTRLNSSHVKISYAVFCLKK